MEVNIGIDDSDDEKDKSTDNIRISTLQISDASFIGNDIDSKIKQKMKELKKHNQKNDDKSFLDISGFNMDNNASFLDYTIDHGNHLFYLIL